MKPTQYEGLGRARGLVDRAGPGGLGRGLLEPAVQDPDCRAVLGQECAWGTRMSREAVFDLMESLNLSFIDLLRSPMPSAGNRDGAVE